MRFGIGLFSMQTHPKLKYSHEDLYRNTIEQVEIAEQSGFDSAWLSEHHFLEDGYCPSPLVMASALLARTTSIKVGTSILILPLHDPVRIAEDCAVLDNISGGRFHLGVAIGYRKEEFDGMNVPMKQRPSRIEEGIEILKKCWAEEEFTYKGRRYEYNNINVTPKPVQKPTIPIYIGAFEEPAIRRAGRLGYPLMIGPGRTMPMIKDTLGFYNDEAKKHGVDHSKIKHILLRETYVNVSSKKASELGDRLVISMYKFYFTLGIKMIIRGKQVSDINDPLFQYLAEDRFIIGDPDYCNDEITRYREEAGTDCILTRMVFPEATDEIIKESIKLFGKEVISKY